MTQEVANFFVSEARRNMHRANSINEEDDLLVYNWLPHFTGETHFITLPHYNQHSRLPLYTPLAGYVGGLCGCPPVLIRLRIMPLEGEECVCEVLQLLLLGRVSPIISVIP